MVSKRALTELTFSSLWGGDQRRATVTGASAASMMCLNAFVKWTMKLHPTKSSAWVPELRMMQISPFRKKDRSRFWR